MIPSRGLFVDFQLSENPVVFFDTENETLVEATNTIKENFAYFEVTPPTLNNAPIVGSSSGLNPNQFSYYNTDTEYSGLFTAFYFC